MLLEMALGLVTSGVPLQDRAALYSAFVDQLGMKSGVEGLGVATVVLGTCFAWLLDEGRRYADPYTWRRLLVDAARAQADVIGPIDVTVVDDAARRSGLIARLGQSETVAAVHDSLADYLAGLALARGAVGFPAQFEVGDEERLLFAAEIGGMDRAFRDLVATRLPFALPRFVAADRSSTGDQAPEEVSAVLRAVMPAGAPAGVDLWRAPDGRVVALTRADGGRWLTDDEARAAMGSRAWVAANGGALDLAVRLWRQWLQAALQGTGGAGLPRPRTAEEACDAVVAQMGRVAVETDRLIRATVPPSHHARLRDEIGPAGLTGYLEAAPAQMHRRGDDWTVAYTRTVDTNMSVASNRASNREYRSHATLQALIGRPPSVEAAERIKTAINGLAGRRWL
ncbi:hypothetical protein BJF82_10435 [Kytococcus sp. CUA-901]|nr:hypothetical protein BJF82_10435 [Kytococcus sp. CUA-901]